MNSSTYNTLQIFHAIVAEGSIAGAAKWLQVDPPSVNQALKLLEKHNGVMPSEILSFQTASRFQTVSPFALKSPLHSNVKPCESAA